MIFYTGISDIAFNGTNFFVPLVMVLGIGMAAFTVFALAILSTSSRLQDASWRQCATLFGSNTRHFGKNSHNDGKTESVVAGRYKRLRSNGN